MLWRIKLFFYLSVGFSLCGFIFPTGVTVAIGYHIGDMVHWIYGYYTLFPRDPSYEIVTYISNNRFQAYFLIFITAFLVIELFAQMRYARLDDDLYKKNRIYIVAVIQLMANLFYISSEFLVMMLSSWGFIFSATFALIGNKELKLFYIDKGIVNAKREKIVGILLIPFPLYMLVGSIHMLVGSTYILEMVVLYGIDEFMLSFVTMWLPELILLLIPLIYGINLLIRAKRKNKSKLHS